MLGEKIRKIRLEKKISLRDLAQKTQLTPSFISQMERDLVEPSITSLRRIAEAMEVPIFRFLMDDKQPSPLVRKSERKILKMPKSRLVYELLSPDLDKSMEMWIGKLEPGAVSCDEALTHPGEECILVLQGVMEVILGEESYTLHEGDSIYYYGTIPHQLINKGKEELVFVSAITPAMF